MHTKWLEEQKRLQGRSWSSGGDFPESTPLHWGHAAFPPCGIAAENTFQTCVIDVVSRQFSLRSEGFNDQLFADFKADRPWVDCLKSPPIQGGGMPPGWHAPLEG